MKHLSNSKQNVPCIQPRLNENEMKMKMKKKAPLLNRAGTKRLWQITNFLFKYQDLHLLHDTNLLIIQCKIVWNMESYEINVSL